MDTLLRESNNPVILINEDWSIVYDYNFLKILVCELLVCEALSKDKVEAVRVVWLKIVEYSKYFIFGSHSEILDSLKNDFFVLVLGVDVAIDVKDVVVAKFVEMNLLKY